MDAFPWPDPGGAVVNAISPMSLSSSERDSRTAAPTRQSEPFRPDRALKTLTHALIRQAGGIEAAAAGSRVGKSVLAGYYAPHDASHIPVDVAAELETLVGEPLVTAEMARRQGYALVPVTAQGEGELPECFAKFGAKVGATFGDYAASMADGELTQDERAVLQRDLMEVVRIAQSAIAALAVRS